MVNKKLCYLEPDFPETGYFVSMLIKQEITAKQLAYPQIAMFRSLDEVMSYLEIESRSLLKEKMVVDRAIVLKMKYYSRVPLIAKYWTETVGNLSRQQTAKAFTTMMKNPGLYRILVVPKKYHLKTKTFDYGVAYPFYISADNKPVEFYMYRSKEYVNPKAKSAAMYLVEEKLILDWKTRLVKKMSSSGLTPEMVN